MASRNTTAAPAAVSQTRGQSASRPRSRSERHAEMYGVSPETESSKWMGRTSSQNRSSSAPPLRSGSASSNTFDSIGQLETATSTRSIQDSVFGSSKIPDADGAGSARSVTEGQVGPTSNPALYIGDMPPRYADTPAAMSRARQRNMLTETPEEVLTSTEYGEALGFIGDRIASAARAARRAGARRIGQIRSFLPRRRKVDVVNSAASRSNTLPRGTVLPGGAPRNVISRSSARIKVEQWASGGWGWVKARMKLPQRVPKKADAAAQVTSAAEKAQDTSIRRAKAELASAQQKARKQGARADMQAKAAAEQARIDGIKARRDAELADIDSALKRDGLSEEAEVKLLQSRLEVLQRTSRELSGPSIADRMKDRLGKWRDARAQKQRAKTDGSDTPDADKAARRNDVAAERAAAQKEMQEEIAEGADKLAEAADIPKGKFAKGVQIATVLLSTGAIALGVSSAIIKSGEEDDGDYEEEEDDDDGETRDELENRVVDGLDPVKLSDMQLFKLFYQMKPDEFEALLQANGLTIEEFDAILAAMQEDELSDDDEDEGSVKNGFQRLLDYVSDLLERFVNWLAELFERVFGRIGKSAG